MKAELSTLLNFIWKEGVVVEGKEDPYLVGLFPQKRDGRVNFLYYNTNRTTKLYSSPITTIICLLRPSFLSQYHRRSEPRTSSKKTATTLNPKTAMDGVVEKEDLRLPSFLFFFFFTTTHASPPLNSISRRCLLLLFFCVAVKCRPFSSFSVAATIK